MTHRNDGGDLKTEVVYYSGYKGREEPRLVRRGEMEFAVARILKRGRREDRKGGGLVDYFICILEDGQRVLIESSKKGGDTVRFWKP